MTCWDPMVCFASDKQTERDEKIAIISMTVKRNNFLVNHYVILYDNNNNQHKIKHTI